MTILSRAAFSQDYWRSPNFVFIIITKIFRRLRQTAMRLIARHDGIIRRMVDLETDQREELQAAFAEIARQFEIAKLEERRELIEEAQKIAVKLDRLLGRRGAAFRAIR